jgi:hypothetical protein
MQQSIDSPTVLHIGRVGVGPMAKGSLTAEDVFDYITVHQRHIKCTSLVLTEEVGTGILNTRI